MIDQRIKAIETIYDGFRFRSRLEARWAVFFDSLGIEYRYEPEGFELEDGVRYLPDFYIPRLETWVEIKPNTPTQEERKKVIQLCRTTKESVVLFAGDVWIDVQGWGFYPFVGNRTKEGLASAFEETPIQWLSPTEGVGAYSPTFLFGCDLTLQYIWSTARWTHCTKCNNITLLFLGYNRSCECKDPTSGINTQHLMTAYETARQARF